MYKIYIDRQLLYSPDTEYIVLQPKITQELNKAGSLTFVMPAQNNAEIKRLKSIVTVTQDGEEIFRGRVLHDERDFYNRRTIYCEGELTFLLDSIQRPFNHRGDIPELFEMMLTNHNNQVEQEKQFLAGQITVEDPNNYIYRWNDGYNNTLECLEEKLLDTHGGYLKVRKEGEDRYLDYLASPGGVSGQVIQFGRNLIDLSEYITAEDIVTVLIPLGAEQEDGSRLTVEAVNDGKDCIENQAGIELFGRIVKTAEWDDVTLPQNLLSKAQEYLRKNVEMSVSINIKAVDLHLLDVDVEKIKLGNQIRVISPPHGIDRLFLCSAIKLDLENPAQTEYTLGANFAALTEKQIKKEKTILEGAAETKKASKNAVAIAETAAENTEAANEGIRTIGQVIAQLPSEYVSLVSFNKYQADMAAALAAYALRSEMPTVPSVVSAFTNDAGYLTQHQDLSGYALRSELAKLYQAEELITQGTDLDNLTTPGVYISRWSSVSATLTNCPVTGGFRLETRQTNTGAGYLSQTIYPNANAALIFRREQSNGSWTGWYKFTGTAV